MVRHLSGCRAHSAPSCWWCAPSESSARWSDCFSSGRTWDEYGKHHLLLDTDRTQSSPRGSAASTAGARRRDPPDAGGPQRPPARRGEPEIDVEQELARLTAPQIDAELRDEIRDLVIARNHRRARQGKPPLDVEAEIAREIAALSGV